MHQKLSRYISKKPIYMAAALLSAVLSSQLSASEAGSPGQKSLPVNQESILLQSGWKSGGMVDEQLAVPADDNVSYTQEAYLQENSNGTASHQTLADHLAAGSVTAYLHGNLPAVAAYPLNAAELSHPLAAATESYPFPPDNRAMGALSSAAPERRVEAEALLERVKEEGTVRVIVTLNQSYSYEHHLQQLPEGEERASRQQQRLVALQQEVATDLGRDPSRLRNYRFSPILALEVDAGELSRLIADPRVATISEDRPHSPKLAESTPLIGSDLMNGVGYDGSDTTVAIIDTGVEANHPFLAGRVVAEACFSTDAGYGSLCPDGSDAQFGPGSAAPCSGMSGCDHGTHVAGIAAGQNAGTGYDGVAPAASIMAVNVFSQISGAISSTTSDIIAGLEHIYSQRTAYSIAAVNLSLGAEWFPSEASCRYEPEKSMIDTLRSAGIAVVAASGNDGFNYGLSSPACIESAISVGASHDGWSFDYNSFVPVDTVVSFSNSAYYLDLLAPGSLTTSSVTGGSYAAKSGTSMAAPHVAGCIALLRQAVPEATVDQIEQALRFGGEPVDDRRVEARAIPRVDCLGALAELNSSHPAAEDEFDFEVTDWTKQPFLHNGDQHWNFSFQSPSEDYDGSLYAAGTPHSLTDDQWSGLQLIRTTEAGIMSFWVRASSEPIFDRLEFYVDSSLAASWSGEIGWEMASFALSAGEHTFTWIYVKDENDSIASGSTISVCRAMSPRLR
jgi:subtilisin family serine protease